MAAVKNERGSVIVFATLMIVVLLIMVGMGLDAGNLVYSRSMGQAAVDSAALSAVTAIPSRDPNLVNARAAAFTENTYYKSSGSPITSANVTLVKYDDLTQAITVAANIDEANGVRVGLEANNPYVSKTATPIQTPAFLTPVLRLFRRQSGKLQ